MLPTLIGLVAAMTVAVVLPGDPGHAATGQPTATAATAAVPPPMVTLLFSRSEISAAANCVRDDTSAAAIDTTVAPYLASLGLAATGSLVTDRIADTTNFCTHNGESLMVSWKQAKRLADTYGWTFVSHTASYPMSLATLTAAQAYHETCGSAQAIDARGLPGGHGLIAYPGQLAPPTALQTKYGAKCFAWARRYLWTGVTDVSAGATAPYWQVTKALNGGSCNDPGADCYSIAAGGLRYNLPDPIMTRIAALRAGGWFTLQSYLLVTGTNPPGSVAHWDCRAGDPRLHWSDDNERYCYSDWRAIVSTIAARRIAVVDPLTAGIAFGRPADYPPPPV